MNIISWHRRPQMGVELLPYVREALARMSPEEIAAMKYEYTKKYGPAQPFPSQVEPEEPETNGDSTAELIAVGILGLLTAAVLVS